MPDSLSAAEIERYARHLTIPGVGRGGQERLRQAAVLIVGTGGLGSPAAMYLAAAGVGRLGLVDFDQVERSNLQRQLLHRESTVGQPKLESARSTLSEINPHVQVVTHDGAFSPSNAAALLADYDLLLDGSDNFPTRFLSNDVCFFAGKPLVHGSIFRFEGQVTVFDPARGGPCYRCMLPTLPPPGAAPSCAEAGVIGVLPGIIGSLQAMEAIKLILDLGEPPLGRMLCYDGLRSNFRSVRLPHDPRCRLCGPAPEIDSLENTETLAAAACTPAQRIVSVDDLATAMARTQVTLIDVREPTEHAAAAIPGSRLIPLGELPQRLAEIPRDEPLYVHCQSGKRSAEAVSYLARHGFPQALDVAGGIEAWQRRHRPPGSC